MRLGDTEWPDDTEEIIKKNNANSIFAFGLAIIALVVYAFSQVINQSILGAVIALILMMLYFWFIFRDNKIFVGDLIGTRLYRLAINIEKFDGKNDYFRDQAKRNLTKLKDIINEYSDAKLRTVIGFNQIKIVSSLAKLKTNLEKVAAFFDDYEKYKEKQEELKRTIMQLAFSFHNNNEFNDETSRIIDKLGVMEIQNKPFSIPIESRLIGWYKENSGFVNYTVLILLASIYIWSARDIFGIVVSGETKLLLIIPILALDLGYYFFKK